MAVSYGYITPALEVPFFLIPVLKCKGQLTMERSVCIVMSKCTLVGLKTKKVYVRN